MEWVVIHHYNIIQSGYLQEIYSTNKYVLCQHLCLLVLFTGYSH